MKTPAAIASTANTVVIVGDTRTLSSGKSPVRINQMPSRSIPKFLPAKLLVRTMTPPTLQTNLNEAFLYFKVKLENPTRSFKTTVESH